jgi:hypothetical protein
LYQPIIDDNITTTGTKLARVIERQRDFVIGFSFDDFQKDAWSLEEQSFSKLTSVGFKKVA